MIDQLEAHGLHVAFIAFALLVVALMTIDCVLDARRESARRRHAAEVERLVGNIERGLVAQRNSEARLLG